MVVFFEGEFGFFFGFVIVVIIFRWWELGWVFGCWCCVVDVVVGIICGWCKLRMFWVVIWDRGFVRMFWYLCLCGLDGWGVGRWGWK